jgi:hypothetical protein
MQAGRLPPPPDILLEFGGTPINIEYTGPLAQAQKILHKSRGITKSLEVTADIMAFKPETADNGDWDEIVKELWTTHGMPQKVINTKDKVAAMREARRRIEQEEQAKQDAERIAGGIKTLAEADRASEGQISGAVTGGT